MVISEQIKIAVSLIEESVSLVDNELVVNFNGHDYILDQSAADLFQIWQDIESGQIAPTSIQNQLTKLVMSDPEYGIYFSEKLEDIKYDISRRSRRTRKPNIHGPTSEAPDWFNQYVEQFEKLESSSRLIPLPRQITPVFKNDAYMMMDEAGQDYVTIWPTPTSMASFGDQGMAVRNKGVYALRKIAHQPYPAYRIRPEDQFMVFVPKIADALQSNNLLHIRRVLEELKLGQFFRRDFRRNTINEWIPSDLFSSFDELCEYAELFIESIAALTTEEPVATLYCRRAVFE